MNKTILSILAIGATISLHAAGPMQTAGTAPKKQFKAASKPLGSPNLAGLGKLKTVMQAHAVKSNALASYRPGSYDPSLIKDIKFATDQKNPVYINSSRVITEALSSKESATTAAIEFIEQNKPILNIHSPKDEFVVKSSNTDELGQTHVKLSQMYMGKPVMGKEMIVHFSNKGTIVTGRWAATPAIGAATGVVGDNTAIANAISSLTGGKGVKPFSAQAQSLLKYTGPTSELVVYLKDNYNDKDRWAYKVTARTSFLNLYETMVDAQTGAVIHSNDISCTTGAASTTLTDLNGSSRTVNTYQHTNGTYYMVDISQSMYNAGQSQMPDNPVGALWTLDAQGASSSNIQVAQEASSNNTSWPNSQTAASASFNGLQAYTYYKNTHNRNSIDGNGGTVISVINVTDDQGQPMDNAFWNGQLMAYGNGDVAFKPLAGGLDVAGHEMTHGVIQSTANLTYQDQSGSLNESFADIFGSMIDKNNWTIGEQVVKPAYFPSGALRDLSNPHNGSTQGGNGWQPATFSEYVTGTSDHGGVHTNSGINNHAFYYFATATSKQIAEKVYYRALTQYLTAGSQYLDCRIAVVQAAQDLYGTTEVQAARTAYDNVEIYDGTNSTPTTSTPVSGQDWIMAQSTTTGGNALYMIKADNPSSTDFHPMNTTFALNNVSITDDGSYAFFIGPDYNIYSLTTDFNNPAQTQITSTGDWENVSVSRDGNRLALISRYQDTAIYIYDGITQQLVKYHLYNPTFSQGQTATNGPIYADAIDWDPTGEFVIYDENNEINNIGGSTNISYWDIGLMQAWDATGNTFGSGQISKLINDLPDGVSIGNPVFSKNHSDIVAFDVSEGSTGTYDIQAANLTTGDIGTIVHGNSVPNIPSYSPSDDAITFSYVDNTSTPTVGIEPLASDFINGNSATITPFAAPAQYSVWFAIGARANAQCAGLAVNITAQGSTDYPISSVVLDAGAGYTSYLWNTGATTQTITVTSASTYNVQVTTGSGCTLQSASLTIGYPTGIQDVDGNSVKVYPVPASDKVYIALTTAGVYTMADVTDMTGRLVMTQPVSGLTQQIDISSIESGIYMINLHDTANSKHYTTRIIKN